jgi:hypothetical protein
MSYTDHYTQKLSIISLIPDEKILQPVNMPVNIYIQETANLYNWCQADREKLTANGLDWSIVEDMPARIDTLSEAQARWEASDMKDIEVEKEWDEKSPAAHGFRKQLVRSLKFRFSDNPAVISRLNRISEGESNSAMIQSLRSLYIVGKEHLEYLRSVNFDITMLDRAAEMSQEMTMLFAAVNSRRAFCSDTLKIRNQAYTYLREAAMMVKKHADFLFWRDPVRMKGYTSNYYRKQYLKRKNEKVDDKTEQVSP